MNNYIKEEQLDTNLNVWHNTGYSLNDFKYWAKRNHIQLLHNKITST